MFKVIRGGVIYAPAYLGQQDILLAANKIIKIGQINPEKLKALDLECEVIEADNCIVMPGIVIDSHFAERGRMGRLLGAVAQNPKNLGVGIDENTAIIVKDDLNCFEVLGNGAIYVLDGENISYSGLSDQKAEGVLSIYDVKLHVLSSKDRFDLINRRPISITETQAKS